MPDGISYDVGDPDYHTWIEPAGGLGSLLSVKAWHYGRCILVSYSYTLKGAQKKIDKAITRDKKARKKLGLL